MSVDTFWWWLLVVVVSFLFSHCCACVPMRWLMGCSKPPTTAHLPPLPPPHIGYCCVLPPPFPPPPAGVAILSLAEDGTTAFRTGTSGACPIVAGVAATILEASVLHCTVHCWEGKLPTATPLQRSSRRPHASRPLFYIHLCSALVYRSTPGRPPRTSYVASCAVPTGT